MRENPKVVTVGAGYFSRFHVAGWVETPQADLVGLADLDRAKAAQLLAEVAPDHVDRVAVSDDPAALWRDLSPDIIDIAAPPAAHVALVTEALHSSAAVIICQKPFCRDLGEARALVRAAQSSGKTLVIHENFRFQPWYRALKAVLDAGQLGEIFQVGFRLRPGDGQGPRAYLDRQPSFQSMTRFLVHETGIHFIDLFRYLLGEPDWVFADTVQRNPAIAGEDGGTLLFGFGPGTRALLDANRLSDHAAENRRLTMGEMVVEGSAAVAEIDGFGRLRLRAQGSNDWQEVPLAIPAEVFGGGCVAAFQTHVAAHLVDGTPLENTAAAYLRNMEIEEAVYRAAELRQAQPL